MSQATSIHFQPLDKKFRNKLERTVKEARDVAEEAARAACKQLGVGLAKSDAHLTDDEKDLRRRLRIHGRQLGDKRDPNKETQQLDRLVDEIAYEHWHRMLFARFLAENDLLMYPDPDDPVSVSIDDCNDLAADEGAKNGWELAARFAARMLPQIFRMESPVFSLTLPPENQQQLERLLSELPSEVFSASDSLGWVYQFWQAKRKDEVNASEVKIGARELPAVTQLFTEPYMVSFLLDNSLGAWWAAQRLSEEDLRTAENEQELRDKASLPGVPFDYLRFVKDEENGAWTPAAGTFDSWPKSLAELKTLDPCCGSGHFLVAAMLMLAPIRMELEGLSAPEAVDRVLSENLHGLEIDQRCVELAAFSLALAAWRFPEAGSYRTLPDLNVACCGLSVSVAKEEWKELAKDDRSLRIALDWMYDEFKDAPVLGSLLNPARSIAATVVEWDTLSPILEIALNQETSDEENEVAVVAHGLAKSGAILGNTYDWIITNVPYLSRGKQSERLRSLCEQSYGDAKNDLATVFLRRSFEFASDRASINVVIPQNWLFLTSYEKFRKRLLIEHSWAIVAKLGAQSFQTPMYDFNVQLLSISRVPIGTEVADGDLNVGEGHFIAGLDASEPRTVEEKARLLASSSVERKKQCRQLQHPDTRISFASQAEGQLLNEISECYQGLVTGDIARFTVKLWEVGFDVSKWVPFRRSNNSTELYGDVSEVLLWEEGNGALDNYANEARSQLHDMHESGNRAWTRTGIAINRMAGLHAVPYFGEHFDNNVAVVLPNDNSELDALYAFVASPKFASSVREIDQAIKVTNRTLLKIPFDLDQWQQVAADKYPHGLPQPYSADPTQWKFHGHPGSSEHALQVAVARLLGYRWPTELDDDMELATDARAWVDLSSGLTDFADSDGIVCVPAVGTEHPGEDRLLNLLHKAYEDGRIVEKQFREKLAAGDTDDPLTVALLQRDWQPSLPSSFNDWLSSLLESAGHTGKTLGSWLREKFFTQHCKQFDHRPFIWHIWDGLKDGFSVLVNYHRLDNKLLKTLIYTYLNDWINRQKQDAAASVDGSEEKLAAAEWLKERLELILKGESPHDIFIRWKPLDEQPIGWNPDPNDGVRLNIRPWLTVGDVKKKGAGLLRDKPNIHWKKDRGKDVESAPWYHLGPEYDGKEGDRINDHHLTLEEKQAAQETPES